MKTWADEAQVEPPGLSIDRGVGEGPPRCCARRLVAADALVHFGDLLPALLAKVLDRFPHLGSVPPDQLYLCDGCRGSLRREAVLKRDEEPNLKVRAE